MQQEQSDPSAADLQTENEILKIKLQLEHGANFFKPEGTEELAPDVENQWLKHIAAFERAYAQPYKEISVHEFCGSPEVKLFDDLLPGELPDALDKLREIFAANNISLDACAPVDDETMYKFITDRFFPYMIEDMRVPGMMNCFIYEEFFDD